MTTDERTRIQHRTAEATEQLRAIVVDLDGFLALAPAQRAARWRQFDAAAKFQLVAQAYERRGVEWDEIVVAAAIVHWDERYAPSPVEAAVEAALEAAAEENAGYARAAEAAGVKSDVTFFRRQTTAYTNALIAYRHGVRPELLASGAYLLPSRRPGEAPHIVRMDGDWVCTCKAGASMHWPIALVIGHEMAFDDLDAADPAPGEGPRGVDDTVDDEELPDDGPTDYDDARARLITRLAAARSARLAA